MMPSSTQLYANPASSMPTPRPARTCIALALAFASTLASSAACSAQAQPSLKVHSIPERAGVTYAYTTVDPALFSLTIKHFEPAIKTSSLEDHVQCAGVAVSGGFTKLLNDRHRPDGLLVTDSTMRSPIARWGQGGVISIHQNKIVIRRLSEWQRFRPPAEMALQSKPLLVFDGQIDGPLTIGGRANRVGVGLLRNGTAVIIGAFMPENDAVTLLEFANDARSIFGDSLMSLLNLDGGPSAFVFMKSGTVRLRPLTGPVNSYVCVEAK